MPKRQPEPFPGGPTPIPGNTGYYPSSPYSNVRIPVQQIDQLEQQFYGTNPSATPFPYEYYHPDTPGISGSPGGPGDYNPTGGPYAGSRVGSQPGAEQSPLAIPGIMSPTGNFNYYDAGNGVVYVYDQNWNYVGTTHSSTQPSNQPQGMGVNAPPSSVGSYFNGAMGGYLPNAGNAISGPTALATTWSNANTGNSSVYAPRAIGAGGSISSDPAQWGTSGGIGPQGNLADLAVGAAPFTAKYQ